MSSETIWQELELFRQKIAYFFGQFLLFARQLIRDPSIVPRGDLVLMGATALIVVLFLLGGLIRFFTEPWKKKLQTLLGLLIFLLVLAAAAFFVLRGMPLPPA